MSLDTEFDKIMEYSPDNRLAFDAVVEAITNNCVVPFIGAGLSAGIYPLWAGALKELSSKLISFEKRKSIDERIEKGEYDIAAELIVQNRPALVFYRDMLNLFNENKLNGKTLSGMSVYLLPFLFPHSPIITTNYDRLLEHVYCENNSPFEQNVLTPKKYIALKAAAKGLHILFKIHGDIGKTNVNEQDIVFTKTSYETYYAKGGDLISTLRVFFLGKQILFLGSSLSKDRTFEVFKEVCAGEELEHFAILPCKKEELESKASFLENERILPMLYDPNSTLGHGAVKVILEMILRRINPESHRDYIKKISKEPAKITNTFLYTTRASKFVGREKELANLLAFAADEDHFKWSAVLGPGGMGKSRLSLEIELLLKEKGWNVIRLNESHYESITTINNEFDKFENTLVIADYGQGHAEKLGRWMRELVLYSTGKIRLIVLERDNTSTPTTPLVDQLSFAGDEIRDYLWNDRPIILLPLNKDELIEIMRSYAAFMKKEIGLDELKGLLKVLEKVDEGLLRPLYALFITDAMCEGENPRRWDRRRVLDWCLTREERIINRNIEEHKKTPVTEEQSEVLRKLRVITTFCGDIDLEKLKREYPTAWAEYSDEYNATEKALVNQLVKAGLVKDGKMLALRPDLLGEYFVLKEYKNIISMLFNDGWADNANKLEFLFRLIYDYRTELSGNRQFFKMVLSGRPVDYANVFYYCQILTNIIGYFKDESARAIEKLRMISEESYPDSSKIALEYAKGLVNTIESHISPGEYEKTLKKVLELLKNHFPENDKIAFTYTQGLVNLIWDRNDYVETAKITEELRVFSEELFPGNPDFAYAYAQGLYNHLCNQKETLEIAKTIDKLRSLSEDHYPNSIRIASVYAQGLVNISIDQKDYLDKMQTTCALRDMSENRFPGSEEIAVEYAKGLVNLSSVQIEEDLVKTIEKLRELSEDHYQKSAEIALAYAQGLVNLLFAGKKTAEEEDMILGILRYLSMERFPDYINIAIEYADGLFTFSYNHSDPTEIKKTIEKLGTLSEEFYPDNVEIAISYAKGLYNLLCKPDDSTDMKNIIKQLRKLSELRFKTSIDIAIIYAQGLFAQGLNDDSYAKENEALIMLMPEKVICGVKEFFSMDVPMDDLLIYKQTYPRLFAENVITVSGLNKHVVHYPC